MTENLLIQKLQLKERRSGAAGAPASLAPAEPAYNHVDKTLYIGQGAGAGGNAASVEAIASKEAHDRALAAVTSAEMQAAIAAITFASLAGFETSKVARLDGATFTASPLAPTPAEGDNSQKVATTQFVSRAVSAGVSNLVGGAPEDYDTLKELFDLAQSNASAREALAQGQTNKCDKSANLSDLADIAAARQNLGLGALATQDSITVAEISCGIF